MRVKTDQKREQILETAAEVFLEQGFERASMALIAARLGGSKSTLYGYFESKTELFIAVILEAGRKEIGEAMADLTLGRRDLRATLVHFSERYVKFLLSERTLAMLRTVIGEAGQSDIGQRFFDAGPRQAYLHVQAFFEQAIEAGLLKPCNAERAAHHFLALVQAETSLPSLYGAPLPSRSVRAIVSDAVDVFLAAHMAPAQAA